MVPTKGEKERDVGLSKYLIFACLRFAFRTIRICCNRLGLERLVRSTGVEHSGFGRRFRNGEGWSNTFWRGN